MTGTLIQCLMGGSQSHISGCNTNQNTQEKLGQYNTTVTVEGGEWGQENDKKEVALAIWSPHKTWASALQCSSTSLYYNVAHFCSPNVINDVQIFLRFVHQICTNMCKHGQLCETMFKYVQAKGGCCQSEACTKPATDASTSAL